jgi:hypothetical protein
MDGTVHATPAAQGLVRRVCDGIDLLERDVAGHDLEASIANLEGGGTRHRS